MSRAYLELLKSQSRTYRKGAISVHVELPQVGLSIAPPSEVAEGVARNLAAMLRGNISQGMDAHGRRMNPKQSTLARRLKDMAPPKQSRSDFRRTRKGKVSKRTRKNRYTKRYEGGHSLGGSGGLVDSGLLRDGITVEPGRGANWTVSYPRSRTGAILGLKKKGYEIAAIPEGLLQRELQAELNRILEPFSGTRGLLRNITTVGLGAVLRGVGQGLRLAA